MTQLCVIFLTSIFAGFILGAPVGVAGALVADAALAHNRRRLELILAAAIAGETLLAFITSFASDLIRSLLEQYQYIFHLISGIVVIMIGIGLFISTATSDRGIIDKSEIPKSEKWLIGHTAAPLAAFLCNLIHPGSIFAFLFTVATFSTYFPTFSNYNCTFALGIMIGSGAVFTLFGVLFWKIREKADKFVHYFRYGLAVIVGLFGVYLLISTLMKN